MFSAWELLARRSRNSVIRLITEGVGGADHDVIDECIAADALDHHALLPDWQDMRAYTHGLVAMLHGALPDLRVDIDDLVVEGNRVTVRVTVSGTHTRGPLFGVPATGRAVHSEDWHFLRCDLQGRIIEHRSTPHDVNLRAQAVA
jgi:predicted ester cyclase